MRITSISTSSHRRALRTPIQKHIRTVARAVNDGLDYLKLRHPEPGLRASRPLRISASASLMSGIPPRRVSDRHLLKEYKNLIGFNCIPRRYVNGLDRSRQGRVDFDFHFHSVEDQQELIELYALSWLYQQARHNPGKRTAAHFCFVKVRGSYKPGRRQNRGLNCRHA